jgi:hypothetical protein
MIFIFVSLIVIERPALASANPEADPVNNVAGAVSSAQKSNLKIYLKFPFVPVLVQLMIFELN